MCGIACILSKYSVEEREKNIRYILQGIEHRGRDDAGIYNSCSDNYNFGLTIGHCRLSIIDLDRRSRQPFTSFDESIVVAFNGEIYNYRELKARVEARGIKFRTESDTEVIVNGYICFGERVFDELEGMFAIILYDLNNKKVFFVRDYFGVKPLFIYKGSRGLVAASESRPIARFLSIAPDPNLVHGVAAFGYSVGFTSVYPGVDMVDKGVILSYKINSDTWQQRQLECLDDKYYTSCGKKNEVGQCLDECIHAQKVSDVGYGVFLSGGIDSGLIAATLAQDHDKFPVYTAGNLQEDGSDANRALLLAKKYDLELFNADPSGSEIITLMEETFRSISEPILDSALIYSMLLSRLAKDNGTKVVLSGAGGDELFYGYTRYRAGTTFRRLFDCIPYYLRKFIASITEVRPLKYRLMYPLVDFALQISGTATAVKNQEICYIETESFKRFGAKYGSNITEKNAFDVDVYLVNNILLGFDQTTMANTIEGRVPFLNRRLYKLSRDIDISEHMKNGNLKAVLREVASDRLPKQYLNAKKQGFAGPIDYWVNSNKSYFFSNARKGLNYLFENSLNRTKMNISDNLSNHDVFNLCALYIWVNKNAA